MEVRVPPTIVYFERRVPAQNVRKFWAIRFSPSDKLGNPKAKLDIFWGRIGTSGGSTTLTLESDGEGLAEARLRAEKKLAEGYIAVDRTDWRPWFFPTEQETLGSKLAREMSTLSRAASGAVSGIQSLGDSVSKLNISPELRDGDGWPVVNGRSRRPPSRGRSSRDPRMVDPIAERDYFPPEDKPRITGFDRAKGRDFTVTVKVEARLSGERVIDFED